MDLMKSIRQLYRMMSTIGLMRRSRDLKAGYLLQGRSFLINEATACGTLQRMKWTRQRFRVKRNEDLFDANRDSSKKEIVGMSLQKCMPTRSEIDGSVVNAAVSPGPLALHPQALSGQMPASRQDVPRNHASLAHPEEFTLWQGVATAPVGAGLSATIATSVVNPPVTGSTSWHRNHFLWAAQLLVLAVSWSLAATLGFAQQSSKSPLQELTESSYQARRCGDAAISPNGESVAWVCDGEIWLKDLNQASSEPRRIAQGSQLAWSPDSHRLAFLSASGRYGQSQLTVVSAGGGAARRLTNLTGALSDPQWSPDGKSLAFLFIKNAPRHPGPMQPMLPSVGVIGKHVFEQRLAVLDVASGSMRVISPPDLYVYEYDWSPDGKEVAATAARGEGDNQWYVAQLYVIHVDSSRTRSILKPRMQIGAPQWSPDGKKIAFIGGLISDQGTDSGDIYLIPREGGRPRDVTQGIPSSPRGLGLTWLSSDRILFCEYVDGESGIAELDLKNGKTKTLWTGMDFSPEGGSLGSFSVAKGGRNSAVELESFDRPPEIWAGPVGAWKQITHINQGLHPAWGKVKSLHWKNGPWRVQGWLFYPRNYNPHHRYPMVVKVHGGPCWISPPGWPGDSTDAELSNEGYFVLLPNPRGSLSEGEEYTRANVRDIGGGDLQDILAGVKKVVDTLPVDKKRIGIYGWSYGGYMTMWAVTQTHIFHAAVAGAGISDWLSYYGEADIPLWVIPYFGASPYDDPAIYARSAPINYVKNVKTPTLMLVGALDGECPAPQSLEFWHALKTFRVKTRLVIYPGEGHGFNKPHDQRDVLRRRLEWFNEFLK